jgi:hypothetical protein
MNVNSVSSNPILNNPTFNKTQTRELPADQALDAQTRTDTRSILPEDTLSLSASTPVLRPGQVQAASSELSADAAQTMTRTLTQLMNNNPSQAMQAIGIPDNRMVQSLLSVV